MNDSSRGNPVRIYLLVAIVAVLVYWNAMRNMLVYDSMFMIESNQTFRDAANADGYLGKIAALGQLWHEGFWDGVNKTLEASRTVAGQALYRPLMMLSLGITYVTFGAKPIAFNILNLLMHLISSYLVARLAWRLSQNRTVTLIAGVLFAAHPLHAEAVAYAVGIGETQATAFSLAALLTYGSAVKSNRFLIGRYLLSILLFAIALFTKESAAATIILIVLFDFARREEAPQLRQRLFTLLGFLVIVAINMIVRYEVIGRLTPDGALIGRLDNPLINEPFMVRLATGCTLYLRVIQLFLIPIGQSPDYSFNELPIARSLLEPAALSAFLVLAAMTAYGIALLRRSPTLAFGFLLFLFSFGPLSNIPLAHGTIFGERLTYFPSVGLALAAGVLLTQLLKWADSKGGAAWRVARATIFLLLVTYGYAAAMRNRIYKSHDSIYEEMVRASPNSARAAYLHGENERRKKIEKRGGNLAQAVIDQRRAIQILPEFAQARMQLGITLSEQGEYEVGIKELELLRAMLPDNPWATAFKSEITRAIQSIWAKMAGEDRSANGSLKENKALAALILSMEEEHRDSPNDLQKIRDLATLYMAVERFKDAEQLLQQTLVSVPGDDGVESLLAQALVANNKTKEAIVLIDQLLDSPDPGARNIATLYKHIDLYAAAQMADAQGEKQQADELFAKSKALATQYIEAKGDRAIPYFNRAMIHRRENDLTAAMKDLQAALTVEPSFSPSWLELPRVAIALGAFNENLVKYFTQVEKDKPTLIEADPDFQIGFARVLEAMGRPEDALLRVEKAIQLGLNGATPHAYLGALLNRLERYDECVRRLGEAERKNDISFPDLIEQMGVALFESEHYDLAEAAFRRGVGRAKDLVPTDPNTFTFWVFQLQFQLGKTLLRIKDREPEGRSLLAEVQRDLELLLANLPPNDSGNRKTVEAKRAYVIRQVAWGLRNVPSMKNDAQAIQLLEEALNRVLALELKQVAQDLGADLLEALRATGQEDKAKEIESKLPKS